jgi:surface carbohydrate biosynthesis protein
VFQLIQARINTLLAGMRAVLGINSWRIPKKSNVLIYDKSSVRHLEPFIDTSNASVFDTSLYSINIWALLRGLAYGRPCMQTYLYGYIALVKPKVVITLIDNSIPFYFINHQFPNIETIAIQNGRRDNYGRKPHTGFLDLLNIDHGWGKPTASHYCMFGEAEISLLRQYIDADFIATGNIQNNSYPQLPLTPRTRPRVSFVSSHPNLSHDLSLTALSNDIYMHIGSRSISFYDYYRIEREVAKAIALFCATNDCDFHIVGKRPETTPQERSFYADALGAIPHTFNPCSIEGASYPKLLDSDVVATVDSTIAYEIFGRGQRVAFISVRGEAIGDDTIDFCRFASPLSLPSEGGNWTSAFDQSVIEAKMKFVLSSSDSEWNSVVGSIASDLVFFDEGNTRLRTLFTSLGIAR